MRMASLALFSLATLLLLDCALSQAPIVQLRGLGSVRGDEKLSYIRERPYYRYRGIPFAKPPIGPLRFQPPEPAEPWTGELDGTMLGQACPQTGIGGKSIDVMEGVEDRPVRPTDHVEDCLYLNVFTPKVGKGKVLPVMVWFYGGAFMRGSGLMYDGLRFMDHDVVLVVPHYRLGPLGFLNLHTEEIPGNAAMLDQVLTLRWVREHVAQFGGDPEQVTVFGESAGATSTALLNLSPLSTGLFKRYIVQSGSSTSGWAIDPEPVRGARSLAKLLNCTGTEVKDLTACFQQVEAMTLVKTFDLLAMREVYAGRLGFACSAPTVQTAGKQRFLEKHPRDILASGEFVHKSAIIGTNKHEGTMIYVRSYFGYLRANGLLTNEEFMKRGILNHYLELFGVDNAGEAVSSMAERAHFSSGSMGNITAMTGGLVDFVGNLALKTPSYELAVANSAKSPTFLYSYSFLDQLSLWWYLGYAPLLPGGVCHANELLLMFDLPGNNSLSDCEKEVSRKMVHLWTNFAIHGDPHPAASPVAGVPSWPPLSPHSDPYLHMDSEFTMRSRYPQHEYFVAGSEGFPWIPESHAQACSGSGAREYSRESVKHATWLMAGLLTIIALHSLYVLRNRLS